MAVAKKHIIRKLFVDVLYHSAADGLQLQKEVTDWCRNQLLPQLEVLLETYCQDDAGVQISTMEIEVALDATTEWQQPAIEKLSLQLNDRLQLQLHAADDLVTRTLVRSFEEQFVYFLHKGYLPWWTLVETPEHFLQHLREWLLNENRNCSLIAAALQTESARKRLVHQLPDELFFNFMITVFEERIKTELSFLEQVRQFLEEPVVKQIRELSLVIKVSLVQAVDAHPSSFPVAFRNELLAWLQHTGWIRTSGARIDWKHPDLRKPLSHLIRVTDQRQSEGEQPVFAGKKGMEMQDSFHEGKAGGTALSPTGESSSIKENVPDALPQVVEERKEQFSGSRKLAAEKKEIESQPGEEAPLHERESSGSETGRQRNPPGIPIEGIEIGKEMAGILVESETNAGNEPSMQSPAENDRAANGINNNSLPEPDALSLDSSLLEDLLTGPLPTVHHQQKEISRDMQAVISAITGEEGSIYIRNGGLIILAPFLPVFFKRLNVLDNDMVMDFPTAILLLHYLATGRTEAAEFETVLPKILCGLEPEEPVNMQREWQQEWKGECNDLLLSVVEYWSILKDTTVDGLREAFLQRNGKISRNEKEWLLQVEQMPYDMLLQQLPWNISMIQLKWMKRMIRTEWT